ncbi:MAG: FAD-binding oxidoreductase [Deltaproteobacteria bacterium]|nr:FAD-binding oxidoreductase [Deltaproteobacteria bacterium]
MQKKTDYTKVQQALGNILGKSRLASDLNNQLLYSRDMMSGGLLEMKAGHEPHRPDVVGWPETVEEVSQILQFASSHKIPVVPFGAGSGVSGGTVPIRGGIMLDLKKMDRIEKIEHKNGTYFVTAQSGIIGQHLERDLNAKGLTLGHFPSSILCATLGGYLACRSAGQLSSKYGKIEDMVEDIEVVLPSGEILPMGHSLKHYPGVHPCDLFIGTEGCLGVITRSKLRAYPLPKTTRYRGINFNHMEDALKAIREILQAGIRPAVVRLYDPMDSLLLQHGYKEGEGLFNLLTKKLLGQIPLPREKIKKIFHQYLFQYPAWLQKAVEMAFAEVTLILSFEGDPQVAEAQEEEAMAICKRSICRDLGEAPGLHWEKHRYSVSFKMPTIFEQDAFVDTIEVAATWDRLSDLYHQMRKTLGKTMFVLAHFSHAYPEGCSIYFTIIGRTGSTEGDLQRYREVWDEAMETCLAAGGTISHHHGIGLLKAKFLPRELGGAMDLYREMKQTLDPQNIMNPGKMGL